MGRTSSRPAQTLRGHHHYRGPRSWDDQPATTVARRWWSSPTARRCRARTQTGHATPCAAARMTRSISPRSRLCYAEQQLGHSSRATIGPTATRSCRRAAAMSEQQRRTGACTRRPCCANGATTRRRSGRYRTRASATGWRLAPWP